MYVFADIITTCKDPGLVNILMIIKKAMHLVGMLGPILAIISLALILIKLMANPENKKLKNAFKNWLIALLMLFFVPIIVNVTMKMLDDSFSVSACWNLAEQLESLGKESTYNEGGNKKPSHGIIIDPDDYQKGEEKKEEPSSSPGSSNSNNNNNSNVTKRIYVGDSRTVQMKFYIVGDTWSCSGNGTDWSIHGNDVWSCKGSMGLDWMMGTGIPNIESQMSSGSAVIIMMGVNDLYHAGSYVNYINGKVANWTSKGAKVYFVSVNPTDGNKYGNLNSSIDSFNSKLKSGLSSNVTYIDTNSYLKSNGFKTTDGLHYDGDTSKKIYNYVNSHL